MNIASNPYKKECFGDFIENDFFSLSDTQLGIRPNRAETGYVHAGLGHAVLLNRYRRDSSGDAAKVE